MMPPAHENPPGRPARNGIAVAVIVGAVALVYGGSFPGIFTFDDASSVIENDSIRRLGSLDVFHPPANAGVGGRPLANLSFAVNYAISGEDPWSYHAGNVLLHALTALTLFGIVRRAVGSKTALVIAVLWATHPLPASAVNYVAQRTELLVALCCLFTLYSFHRGTEATSLASARGWFGVAFVACAAGMACKETMLVTPLLVLLYDRTFVAGTLRAAWRERGRAHLALASTWLLLAALMLAAPPTERGAGPGLGVSCGDYALTSSRALVQYLRLAVWPQPLVFDYGWDFARTISEVWLQLFTVVLLAVASVVAVVRRPVIGFAACAFFLLLAPTTSFIPIIQQPVAESRMYLPVALVIALGVGAIHSMLPRAAPAVLVTLALALGTATMARNRVFRSPLALWSDTVAKKPDNARARNYFAAAWLESGRLDEAARQAQAAVTLRPSYADAHNNLALARLRGGDADGAIDHLEAALRLDPRLFEAQYNLGAALLARDRVEEAIAHYEAALRLRPNHARTHNNLGVALLERGRIAAAIAQDESAVRLDPKFAEARYNLGNALAAAGRDDEARTQFETALRLDPSLAKAENNLGVLSLRANDPRGAVTHFEAAVRLQPDYAAAQRNLEAARRALATRRD